MNHTESIQLSRRGIRRNLAVLALCALVAAATLTWMGPRDAVAASAPAVLASASDSAPQPTQSKRASAPADDGDSGAKAKSGGKSLRGKLNLNTASAEQLQLLPGIGAAKAGRIVGYREKHGKFRRVRDLRRVKGIGFKTLQKLSPYLSIDGPNNLSAE
ncbi:ComEA family DNA-binding protein [Haliangium ochraceum]|uniref:Competence protein ComEA helix-hairpin-helix repeat protein n=1 Tax=Haliangium ochraceum (strain DSM 14365 / JCM 11303 / SMP-2) TaxID=502025 RepID=D0LIE3_HALO1|nr:ComEA family DNA-binding protein [Haliangium ochraceum]ACY18299.1 competence protein ComEA helix-hairpin-helix repeat protein [Haliangium ochraceum DSM 14365]